MLTELRIQNFAIIEDLTLELGSGLVTFSGETGAGKSILIDAVETLLGVRADASLIRAGDDRATVEGTFRIPDATREHIHAILQREELLDDADYAQIAREFRREGRNVVRINGRPSTVALVRELGELLIDLHGQSEHLSLLRVPAHRVLLDRYAGVERELAAYQKTYTQLQELRRELASLREAEADAARRIELLSFQVQEIEAAKLQPDEEASLRDERTRLANAESLAANATLALTALDESEDENPSGNDRMGAAVDALSALARVDASQAGLHNRAQGLLDEMADVARELRGYLEQIEFNPKRLEEVEERVALLQGLKRKYGDDIPAILAFGQRARKDLENISNAEERLAALQKGEGELLAALAQEAQALSAKRHAAAEELSKGIEVELDDLKMEAARFGVDFSTKLDDAGLLIDGQRVAFDAHGHEVAEFLVAPNPGEGLKPLVKIASGGETARLMLAMKNVLARADHTPTLIFDEIDQGIGGRVGSVVGEKLWRLARAHQVLCVTHLPQLAAYGDQHFKVEKVVNDGRTQTQAVRLKDDARIHELANMFGEVSEGTLQSARELMEAVRATTKA
ncbi:MAG TPA: DNA repair protein RecN [Anaerolineales bacterium]|nr:DNA repair protein RecN [Anaerolineales bacterium]HRQ92337.1 DNA repair protein RecN [Anaerolineales bacterium]